MRFEWLFIGYLLMFQISYKDITILPALGYAIMLFAMLRLQKFEPAFKKAKYVLFAAVPIGCALLGLQIYKFFAGDALFFGFNIVYNIVRIASELAEMSTMLFFYLGIKQIGVNTEIKSLEKHSSRNMAVMGVYLVLELVMTVLSFTLSEDARKTEMFRISMMYPFIVGLIWRVLNLWAIITCYLGVEIDDGNRKEETPSTEKKIQHHSKKKRRKK